MEDENKDIREVLGKLSGAMEQIAECLSRLENLYEEECKQRQEDRQQLANERKEWKAEQTRIEETYKPLEASSPRVPIWPIGAVWTMVFILLVLLAIFLVVQIVKGI